MCANAAMDRSVGLLATDTSEIVATGQEFQTLNLTASGMAQVSGRLYARAGSISATGTARIEHVQLCTGSVRCDPAASAGVCAPNPPNIRTSGPVVVDQAKNISIH